MALLKAFVVRGVILHRGPLWVTILFTNAARRQKSMSQTEGTVALTLAFAMFARTLLIDFRSYALKGYPHADGV
jgi:hypothetical protein